MDRLHGDLSHDDRYCLCCCKGKIVVGRRMKFKLCLAARSFCDVLWWFCLRLNRPLPLSRLLA